MVADWHRLPWHIIDNNKYYNKVIAIDPSFFERVRAVS